MGPEVTEAAYEILGPGGPYQSICDGKTMCVVDLIKRFSTTQGSVCRKLELEGPMSRSNSTMAFMNEDLPDEKGALVMLLKDPETKKMGTV